MLIAGFQKLSMVDFPGRPAAVVFAPYCNMRCWYCHNYQILSGDVPLIPEEYVMEYLEKRKNMLGAVVVSGGEPTLRPDLPRFMEKLKAMGYLTKLDTNGTNPRVVKSLMERNLVDYIAMDIHAPEDKYSETACVPVDIGSIKQTIDIIMGGDVDYEFRVTFAPTLDKEDILKIADMVKGAKAFYLQQYRPVLPRQGERPVAAMPLSHPPEYLRETAAMVQERLGVCELRGL
ncbi:MAG: anaerobic ribonucleoside-triphosphate reductase activating protein [Christensenellales bacterium]|jgi:pyruvate formate lyase activating enzyme